MVIALIGYGLSGGARTDLVAFDRYSTAWISPGIAARSKQRASMLFGHGRLVKRAGSPYGDIAHRRLKERNIVMNEMLTIANFEISERHRRPGDHDRTGARAGGQPDPEPEPDLAADPVDSVT